jgi:hypothetical protein
VLYMTGEGVHDIYDEGDASASIVEGFHGPAKVFEVVQRPLKNFGDVCGSL